MRALPVVFGRFRATTQHPTNVPLRCKASKPFRSLANTRIGRHCQETSTEENGVAILCQLSLIVSCRTTFLVTTRERRKTPLLCGQCAITRSLCVGVCVCVCINVSVDNTVLGVGMGVAHSQQVEKYRQTHCRCHTVAHTCGYSSWP